MKIKQGLVIKTTGSWHTVKDSDRTVLCKIKGNFRQKDLKTTNPVTVGDIVDYYVDSDTGMIINIHPRLNYIIRKSINLSKEAHLLAANIDQAILMVTLKDPVTSLEFIDRFLVTAEAYHINTIILFNKIDIYEKNTLLRLKEVENIYTKIGYKCLQISLTEKSNLGPVIEIITDKISLVAGNSGVGKTTLINQLIPGINLKVVEISEYHKAGKHTTTFSEMIEIPQGGYIIDTPGIKGFGIVDFNKQEIALFFPEIFKKSSACQYYNCTHTHEPNCAIKEAVESEEIASSRYRSYLKIFYDENEKYR